MPAEKGTPAATIIANVRERVFARIFYPRTTVALTMVGDGAFLQIIHYRICEQNHLAWENCRNSHLIYLDPRRCAAIDSADIRAWMGAKVNIGLALGVKFGKSIVILRHDEHKRPRTSGWQRNRHMNDESSFKTTRRNVLSGIFAATTVVAAPSLSKAAGLLRGAGDIRRIRLRSTRTGESVDTIYWVEGKYIPEAMAEINWFMRDWRQNEVIRYDHRNVDIMAATLRLMDTDEAYHVVSGYRSPATNAMLRRRNGGVATKSYHMKGMAADLKLESRSISQMARAAAACNAGGVGKYRRSNFVHMDCGPVRSWRG